MDKIREEFENFVANGAIAPSRFQESITYEQRIYLLGVMFDGNKYSEDEIQYAYEIWKLSRDSIVVELPSKMGSEPLSLYDIGFNDGIDVVIECIEESGVSYE